MAFSAQNIAKAREMVERAKSKMATMREHSEEVIGEAIAATEVGTTALAFGYANARYGEGGELKIAGMPLDLLAGVSLHGISFMGGLGKYSEHGHNIGSGAVAAYMCRMGNQLGRDAREGRGAAAPGTRTAGYFQQPPPPRYSAADYADVGAEAPGITYTVEGGE